MMSHSPNYFWIFGDSSEERHSMGTRADVGPRHIHFIHTEYLDKTTYKYGGEGKCCVGNV